MEHNADVDAGRKRAAIVYLQEFLDRCAGKPSHETAESIVNLAFGPSNPFKDICTAAGSNERPSTAQPSDGIKSSLSKLLRRDNKSGSSENKGLGLVSSVCDLQNQPPGTSALYAEIFGDPPFDKSVLANQAKKDRSRSIGRAASSKTLKPGAHSVFPSSPIPSKASGSNLYRCIICQEQLSSKGVCKRHLDEQHVTPKIFKCEKCGASFEVKKDAKTHSNACGQGVFLYTHTKRDEQKFYACEFTGECFVSKSKYVEHLLALSERTENRPPANPRLKLCALLDQPDLKPQVAEISCKKFGSRHAWKKLDWSDTHVEKAIEALKDMTIDESRVDEQGKTGAQKTRIYLNSLLGAGVMPRDGSQHSGRSRSSTVTPRRSPHGSEDGRRTPTQDSTMAMHPPWPQHSAPGPSHMDGISVAPAPVSDAIMATMRPKRPLSDQSRAFVPGRQPPGPPMIPSYAVGPSMPDPQFAIPNISTTTLPLRTQEMPAMMDQHAEDMYSLSSRTASTATPTLSSDSASVSTLMTNFAEPEFVDQIPLDYNYGMWNTQQSAQNYQFDLSGSMDYGMQMPQLYYANGDPSARASSIATDQTYVADYTEQDQKFANFEALSTNNTAQYGGTFFLEGDDDYHDPHGRR